VQQTGVAWCRRWRGLLFGQGKAGRVHASLSSGNVRPGLVWQKRRWHTRLEREGRAAAGESPRSGVGYGLTDDEIAVVEG
jgi:hypothetical protein